MLNLSAFETFYREKRPFFIEGTGIFRFDLQCHRRQLQWPLLLAAHWARARDHRHVDHRAPPHEHIDHWARRSSPGARSTDFRSGSWRRSTQREVGSLGQTARAARELSRGPRRAGDEQWQRERRRDAHCRQSRQRQRSPATRCADSAYTGGLDFRREFHDHDYRFAGYLAKSQVAGTPQAIALTQANSTHYYQKPDDGQRYDTTRTSLGGDAERLTFEKINGRFQFQEAFIRYSPGFEVNDLGFLTEARRAASEHVGGAQPREADESLPAALRESVRRTISGIRREDQRVGSHRQLGGARPRMRS